MRSSGSSTDRVLNETLLTSPGKKGKLEFLRREVVSGEKAEQTVFESSNDDVGLHPLEWNPNNRQAFVGLNMNMDVYAKVIKSLGRDAIVGKERFFEMPYYWTFVCEKPDVLIESLESMKAAGLVYAFLREAQLVHVKSVSARAKGMTESRNVEGAQTDDPSAVLFPEVGYLFMYGILVSAVGAALEIIVYRVVIY